MKFEVSKLALKDIDSIWDYTEEKWSRTQANKYYKEIFKEITFICKNPEIGRLVGDAKPDHRLRNFKSHIIIYKIKDSIVFIDRVLHLKMDIDNILEE